MKPGESAKSRVHLDALPSGGHLMTYVPQNIYHEIYLLSEYNKGNVFPVRIAIRAGIHEEGNVSNETRV